jgi:hypothetical protein
MTKLKWKLLKKVIKMSSKEAWVDFLSMQAQAFHLALITFVNNFQFNLVVMFA